MKNPALDTLFSRRSIRKFRRKQIPRELITRIVEMGRRAPSARGMQTYSLMLITEIKLREEIYNLIGKQAPV